MSLWCFLRSFKATFSLNPWSSWSQWLQFWMNHWCYHLVRNLGPTLGASIFITSLVDFNPRYFFRLPSHLCGPRPGPRDHLSRLQLEMPPNLPHPSALSLLSPSPRQPWWSILSEIRRISPFYLKTYFKSSSYCSWDKSHNPARWWPARCWRPMGPASSPALHSPLVPLPSAFQPQALLSGPQGGRAPSL